MEMGGFREDHPPSEESKGVSQRARESRNKKAKGRNIFHLYWVSGDVSLFDISTACKTPSETAQQNLSCT